MNEPTPTELRRQNAVTFRTEDNYVRVRWQSGQTAPVVLLMGDENELIAYGLSAEQVQALADALTEMARVLA